MKNTLRDFLILSITVVALTNLQTQNIRAAWGELDSSFGFLGVSMDSLTNYYPKSVALQPDGKILVTGYRLLSTGKKRFFLRRYLANGQPDVAFGNDGSAVSNALLNVNSDYEGLHIALQSNGKIAVAGRILNSGNPQMTALWRFNTNGSSDATIGYGGLRTFSDYSNYSPRALAVQNDKLFIGITTQQYTTESYIYVIRLNANGTIDTTFGTGGEVVPAEVGANSFSMIVESDTGKITVGSAKTPNFAPAGLERLMPDGQRDESVLFANFQHEGFTEPFIRLSTQKYVIPIVPGFYQIPNYKLVKLNANGTYASAITYANAGTSGYCPRIIAQQRDGKVVAYAPDRLFRFDSELNSSSAETMSCSTYFSAFTNQTRAVLQTDDKMIFAGRYEGGGNLVIVRTLPD